MRKVAALSIVAVSMVAVSIISLMPVAVALAQQKPATAPKPSAAPKVEKRDAAAPAKRPAASTPAPTAAAAVTRESEEKAIRQLVDSFAKIYNDHDSAKLAALFTTDAELIDEDGNTAHGRDAIAAIFGGVFQESPEAKIEVAIDSIRFLGPSVAVEEGMTKVTHKPGECPETSRYSVVHVKQDGRWQMAMARDVDDSATRGTDELGQLGWLVGNWIDESADGLVKTSYKWTDNHKFLLGEFTIQISGKPAMNGSQRIGWDPVARQIRSWTFDSEGGFAEGFWTLAGNDWTVKLTGVTRDGRVGSATNYYRRVGADRYSFVSRQRVVGGELQEDTDRIVVVREPPKPGQ